MERFGILPFGCVSDSSVAVVVQQQLRRSNPKPANTRTRHREDDEDEESSSMNMKPHISTGFHKLFKGFKTFSQLLVYREEMEEDMEIGLPTNVKHVAHVGLDESACSSPSRSLGGGNHLFSPRHRFSFRPSPQCDRNETQAAVQSST